MSEPITLSVEAKVLGQRKPVVASWSVELPADRSDAGTGDSASETIRQSPPATKTATQRMTLRELLALVVAAEVAAFHERQRGRRLTRVIGREEIERGAARGKIEMGGREPEHARQEVTVAEAVATALQSFEDRLYLVLLDGAPVDSLESELELRAGSRLTFVRLVALVGG